MEKKISLSQLLFLLFLFFLSLIYLSLQEEKEPKEEPPKVPLGLQPVPWPKDNPYTKEKWELGRSLYYDKRLSSDGTVSCAHCHMRPYGFSEPIPIARGIGGQLGTRKSPTIINSAYSKYLFWDGRASSLEEQALGPIANPKEMTNDKDPKEARLECEKRIGNIPEYKPHFKAAFNDEECTLERLVKAIATFERTVLSGNSRYDRYKNGDKQALTEDEIKGLKIFMTKGSCINCHNGPTFSNSKFTNLGVGIDKPNPDLGRYEITHDEKDWGAFKVPQLRDVSKTAPYMHDGSLKSLEDVIDYYDKGGTPNKNLHPAIHPLNLSEEDKKNLVLFLKALDGEGWEQAKRPEKLPGY